MPQVENGVTVTVNYVAKLDSGEVVDSTQGGPAQEFQVGCGKAIRGFEQAILGMAPGETKTVRLGPEECYGHHREDLVLSLPKHEIPDDMDLQEGQFVNIAEEGRAKIFAQVKKVDPHEITLDANHPLAGKSLTYEIAVLEVTPP